MQQLSAVWQALDARRRLIVVAATLAMFASVYALSGMATKPTMALLYAGLEGARSGDVVTALDQRGKTFEVRGDSIWVPANERDELRMALAAEGLPANGGAGYELLDGLSGFGTTSQMFDAAYWRAKEGELARTISASPHIRTARVHIATPTGQPFRRDIRPSASVSVTTESGALAPAQARALRYLVASAVAGMVPDDVSVIDGRGGLVMSGDESAIAADGSDRAEEFRRNVQRLIEARVGFGKAVVEVSVDTVTEREAITENSFDPQSRVMISTDTEERSNNSNDTRSSGVTVASNLPQGAGAGAGAGGSAQAQATETRERTNFEVSETTREVLKMPGAIKRITVAILVDGVTATDAAGTVTWAPRPDDELASLRELVTSVVGFTESRGDVITIKSMQFEALPVTGTVAGPSFLAALNIDVMSLIKIGTLALVSLVLGLVVLRPILAAQPAARRAELPAPAASSGGAGTALTGEIAEGDDVPRNLPVISTLGGGGLPMSFGTGDYGGFSGGGDDPVARLKRLIEERQDEAVEILRGWMEPQEEKA